MNAATRSVVFVSHGGGPLPLLGDPGHQQMVQNLRTLAGLVPEPAAILVISAHWETAEPRVTDGARPGLIYDYYGFPPASYQISYPAPGAPELAGQVVQCLRDAGLAAASEDRGFDHGLFVPLKIMYPRASIPCIQLSLLHSLDPRSHLRLGAALAALQAERLLVFGSGFSFHNLPAFFRSPTAAEVSQNAGFEAWLADTLTRTDIDERQRQERLCRWSQAPGARFCHPREEHLLPLLVCCAAAGRPAQKVFALEIMGRRASSVLW